MAYSILMSMDNRNHLLTLASDVMFDTIFENFYDIFHKSLPLPQGQFLPSYDEQCFQDKLERLRTAEIKCQDLHPTTKAFLGAIGNLALFRDTFQHVFLPVPQVSSESEDDHDGADETTAVDGDGTGIVADDDTDATSTDDDDAPDPNAAEENQDVENESVEMSISSKKRMLKMEAAEPNHWKCL
eukprot:scaffold165648_cov53-Attheya_sp.AAC.3